MNGLPCFFNEINALVNMFLDVVVLFIVGFNFHVERDILKGVAYV
jgi:hypothetical protein